MKQKMQKNETFYSSKVLKGNSNFMRRDNASGQLPAFSTRVMPLMKTQAHADKNQMVRHSSGDINV